MKRSDLFREWARVLDMCEGTNVLAGHCVKHRHGGVFDTWDQTKFGLPRFDDDPNSYEFAVAIVEDRPVFIGDELYDGAGTKFVVCKSNHRDYSMVLKPIIQRSSRDPGAWMTNEKLCGYQVVFWNPPAPKHVPKFKIGDIVQTLPGILPMVHGRVCAYSGERGYEIQDVPNVTFCESHLIAAPRKSASRFEVGDTVRVLTMPEALNFKTRVCIIVESYAPLYIVEDLITKSLKMAHARDIVPA